MGDGFLKPRDNLGYRFYALFCQVAVHFVAQPDINAAVPKPSDLDVNFDVIDLLKLNSQIDVRAI
jgi:hypothetical protein